jgi:hypothetical protein
VLTADHGHDEPGNNTTHLASGASSGTLKDVNKKSAEFMISGTSALRERLLVTGNRVCSIIHCQTAVMFKHLHLLVSSTSVTKVEHAGQMLEMR